MSERAFAGLAASNIAWEPHEDGEAATLLTRAGFTGVEIAPTTVWPDPLAAPSSEVAAYRERWTERGLRIVAMQALLYARPELRLFGSEAERRQMLDYLLGIVELGARLGAGALVFGSPKNRVRGSLPVDDAMDVATEFFREVGYAAAAAGVVLCVEPNPPAYGCDFITTTSEALALIARVDSPGIRVQGDLGAIVMVNDPVDDTLCHGAPSFGHVHASEPGLAEIGVRPRGLTPGSDPGAGTHPAAASALLAGGYAGFVSIEMRKASDGARLESLARAVEVVRQAYGTRDVG